MANAFKFCICCIHIMGNLNHDLVEITNVYLYFNLVTNIVSVCVHVYSHACSCMYVCRYICM